MRSFLDAKTIAKTLRQELQNRKIELSHSECLEVVAKQFGFRDWNTMAATIDGPSPKTAAAVYGPIPAGWIFQGTRPELYIGGTVKLDGTDDTALAIKTKNISEKPPEGSFGNIMQVCRAEPYRNMRVCFSADIKADLVTGSATLWMRVDDEKNMAISFDNLERLTKNGSLKSSTDWVNRKVIIPVPEAGALLNFGFYLFGQGQAWARNLKFGVTDELPSHMTRDDIHGSPQNLDLQVA
jgi:hypothetical protein